MNVGSKWQDMNVATPIGGELVPTIGGELAGPNWDREMCGQVFEEGTRQFVQLR